MIGEIMSFLTETIEVSVYLIVLNNLVLGLLFFNASLLLFNHWLLKTKIIDKNMSMWKIGIQSFLYFFMIMINIIPVGSTLGVLLWNIFAFVIVSIFNLVYYRNVLKYIKNHQQ